MQRTRTEKSTKKRKRINAKIRRRRRQVRWTLASFAVMFIVFIHVLSHLPGQKDGLKDAGAGNVSLEHKEAVADVTENINVPEETEKTYTVSKPIRLAIDDARSIIKSNVPGDDRVKEIFSHINELPEDIVIALANNMEMVDFALGYIEGHGQEEAVLTIDEKLENYPLFNQWDARWGYESYGDNNIGLSGCGPTALSMVVFSLTRNEDITPDVVARYSMDNGYYVQGTGTSWSLMTEGARHYGLDVGTISLDETVMRNRLACRDMIICAMREGDFTTAGHFIVIYGCNEEGFLINDPNCIQRSNEVWSYEQLAPQIKMLWSFSAQ